jgi:hypothetical protein
MGRPPQLNLYLSLDHRDDEARANILAPRHLRNDSARSTHAAQLASLIKPTQLRSITLNPDLKRRPTPAFRAFLRMRASADVFASY